MQIIRKYFPNLTSIQDEQFAALKDLYKYWNSRINLISRKDIDHLYLHHVLHSLSISRIIQFKPGSVILDAGTGGGFPGIPLAILFPEAKFLLTDSIGKKIRAVDSIIEKTGLLNCTTEISRIEEIKFKFDFVISRAVTRLKTLIAWVENRVSPDSHHALNNGLLYLKGGDLHEELKEISYRHVLFDIQTFFAEKFFETKKIVYIDLTKINH